MCNVSHYMSVSKQDRRVHSNVSQHKAERRQDRAATTVAIISFDGLPYVLSLADHVLLS